HVGDRGDGTVAASHGRRRAGGQEPGEPAVVDDRVGAMGAAAGDGAGELLDARPGATETGSGTIRSRTHSPATACSSCAEETSWVTAWRREPAEEQRRQPDEGESQGRGPRSRLLTSAHHPP